MCVCVLHYTLKRRFTWFCSNSDRGEWHTKPSAEGKFLKFNDDVGPTPPRCIYAVPWTNKNYRNFLRSVVVRKTNYGDACSVCVCSALISGEGEGWLLGIHTLRACTVTMYIIRNPCAPYTVRLDVRTFRVGFSAREGTRKGWDKKKKTRKETNNKITNRDVAVIRATGNNNYYYYYHYGPRRIIIILC